VLAPGVPVWLAVPIWAVAGFGIGLAYSVPSLIVLREASPEEQGSVTAALQLADVLGTALGTGVGGALIVVATATGRTLDVGLAAIYIVAGIVAVVGLLLTRRLGPRVAAGRPPERAAAAASLPAT
jgi:MFS family permease